MPQRDSRTELPRINHWLMSGFEKHFLPRYLRKHFHVVATHHTSLTPSIVDAGTALVLYCNHASWWDPMLALYMRSRLFPAHNFYAPIDATALEQYKIFKSMGFYGIDTSHRGTAEFLKRSLRILQTPGTTIWLTPEGKFCDPRKLDEPIQPGLAHLAHTIERTTRIANDQLPDVCFIPAGIEYVFWEERSPECLCWFGEPLSVKWDAAQPRGKDQWHEILHHHLRQTQKELASASIARDTSSFEVLLRGKVGSGSFYDMARKSWAKLRGQPLSMEHSGLWK